jgi:N-acyl-D-aspartate/D-glutamate deacylase
MVLTVLTTCALLLHLLILKGGSSCHRISSFSRVMVGLSDGGAHVDMLCDAGYATYLLGTWVRKKRVLTVEQAVKRLTAEPAAFFGITQRGKIQQGLAADFAIFDLGTVGSQKRGEVRNDLPGGGTEAGGQPPQSGERPARLRGVGGNS